MTEFAASDQTMDGKINRPISISIICITGFVGTALSIPMVFSEIAKQIGSWFPPYSGFIAVVTLACMIGLWFTKRWAIYAYISLVVLNQVVLAAMNRWTPFLLLVHLIIVITILISLENFARTTIHQLLRYPKRQIWALIVAYMVGIHNFYKEEEKTPEDIVITIEDIEEQEDSSPKD